MEYVHMAYAASTRAAACHVHGSRRARTPGSTGVWERRVRVCATGRRSRTHRYLNDLFHTVQTVNISATERMSVRGHGGRQLPIPWGMSCSTNARLCRCVRHWFSGNRCYGSKWTWPPACSVDEPVGQGRDEMSKADQSV